MKSTSSFSMSTRIPKNATVVTAMSGGVDSSVAAALLVERGFRVIGITMKLWEFRDVGGNSKREATCCTIESMNDARAVCQKLGIPHYVVDFRADFSKYVVDDFVNEYLLGRTPNPCVNCNIKIKWESLLQKAIELGGDYVATGHYAGIGYDSSSARYYVLKANFDEKDQSYALWGLSQESLSRTIFPLGNLRKSDVRGIAAQMGLKTAEKVESQEICFVPDNDYRRLLQERLAQRGEGSAYRGEIVTTEGEVVGEHEGYPYFTIGQRRRLGVALGKPAYVVDIMPDNNRVVIGDKHELYKRGLRATRVNWVAIEGLKKPARFFVKIRYRDPGGFANVSNAEDGRVRVEFEEPQPAITPGQSVVFYDGDRLVGGGIIDESF